jgi:hypothetical protein
LTYDQFQKTSRLQSPRLPRIGTNRRESFTLSVNNRSIRNLLRSDLTINELQQEEEEEWEQRYDLSEKHKIISATQKKLKLPTISPSKLHAQTAEKAMSLAEKMDL